jgi:hypothetical protein
MCSGSRCPRTSWRPRAGRPSGCATSAADRARPIMRPSRRSSASWNIPAACVIGEGRPPAYRPRSGSRMAREPSPPRAGQSSLAPTEASRVTLPGNPAVRSNPDKAGDFDRRTRTRTRTRRRGRLGLPSAAHPGQMPPGAACAHTEGGSGRRPTALHAGRRDTDRLAHPSALGSLATAACAPPPRPPPHRTRSPDDEPNLREEIGSARLRTARRPPRAHIRSHPCTSRSRYRDPR